MLMLITFTSSGSALFECLCYSHAARFHIKKKGPTPQGPVFNAKS